MLRKLRITVLLIALFVVTTSTWLAQHRATSWQHPVRVTIYPINGDGSVVAERYIAGLSLDTFAPIASYMAQQAAAYHLPLYEPLYLGLAPQVAALPPSPPAGGSVPAVMAWSLKLRYFAWRHGGYDGPRPQVKLFVVYFDPQTNPRVAHSLGLQNAKIGVVNAFAAGRMEGSNQVVMTHELLHTLGATDKYRPASGQPIFPIGYADPDQRPRYPQRRAELMGGRIPLSEHGAEIPQSLDDTVIGPASAQEINWVQKR